MAWGFPYLIGRVYFTDLDGLRELALGIAIGGLVYVPLCLFEIRCSPILETWVYGIVHWEAMRYGGYRPKVFLSTGLELGMWMTNASLICYQLWSCGAVKTIRGFGFGKLLLVLLVTTVLCKSTGAIALLVVGIAILWITKRTKRSWAVWLLIAIPPCLHHLERVQPLVGPGGGADLRGDWRARSVPNRSNIASTWRTC